MSIDAEKRNDTPLGIGRLTSELLRLPEEVRQHLAYALLDSLEAADQDGPGADDLDEAEVEAAWAAEAHRRWEAYQRGEEKMLPWDDVIAEIRASFGR